MNRTLSPDNTDAGIEALIQAKGLTHPRVTPADIDAAIVSAHYFTAFDGVMGELVSDGVRPTTYEQENCPVSLKLLTFCVLVLRNGFTVVGESACASPENFDAEVGQRAALAAAKNKMWPLLGYALKERLAMDSDRT
jgi:hypothetical protein